jgi:hypothetical protein
MHPIAKYRHLGIMTGLTLCLFVPIQQAEARRIVDPMGERFAPVTLKAGQNARVTISNLLVPAIGSKPADCPVLVRFFDASGTLLGSEKDVNLKAGSSTSISAASSSAGLVRAIVSIKGDPQSICAIKAFEVFDADTGSTRAVLAGQDCLGNGACSAPLAPSQSPGAGK